MKVGYISDIHIDSGMNVQRLNIFDQTMDVIIVGGDIGNIDQTSDFLFMILDTFQCPIIFVPGNHDFYNGITVEDTIQEYNDLFKDVDIHMLVNGGAHTIHGQTFIGATLWSDLGETYNPTISVATKMAAYSVIADFEFIKDMTVEKMYNMYEVDKQGIVKSLEKHGSDAIIITHFSPSIEFRNELYKIDPLAYYFCGNMESVIQQYQPKAWIYGHTHGNNDPVEYGTTQILCNMIYDNSNKMKFINV